jgi:hypothetical protein
MPQPRTWIVTTSGDRPLGEIANDLKRTGFSIGQVLSEIGAITGSASDDVVAKLRAIPGVADVSPDTPIDIGPPDAPITW